MERKIEDKEQNPRSPIRLSIKVRETKNKKMKRNIISLPEKANLLDDKLAEFVQQGLDAMDYSDIGENDVENSESSQSDDGIRVVTEVEQREINSIAGLDYVLVSWFYFQSSFLILTFFIFFPLFLFLHNYSDYQLAKKMSWCVIVKMNVLCS